MASSEAFARALAFYQKAREQCDKGYLLKAAENFGRAAEAARDLDSGPDNLVVVEMQRAQALMLYNYVVTTANTKAAVDPSVLAAQRADCIALLSAAAAALEQRRVAGTLLAGKCSAAEEAWDAEKWKDTVVSAAQVAILVKLVGYEIYLETASSAVDVLKNAIFFEAECSSAQLQVFARHVMHAADVMQLWRSPGTSALSEETVFAKKLSQAMATGSLPVPLLTDAWQRLQRSGVLEARGILNERVILAQKANCDKKDAAARAAVSAPGLRSCALAGCGAKEAHPQHFKRCSACKLVVYCSKEHQLEACPAHKAACKAARNAAAASAGGAGGSTA